MAIQASQHLKNRHPLHASDPYYELAKQLMLDSGSWLAYKVAGGEAAAFFVFNHSQLVDISDNLDDSNLLACHLYTT